MKNFFRNLNSRWNPWSLRAANLELLHQVDRERKEQEHILGRHDDERTRLFSVNTRALQFAAVTEGPVFLSDFILTKARADWQAGRMGWDALHEQYGRYTNDPKLNVGGPECDRERWFKAALGMTNEEIDDALQHPDFKYVYATIFKAPFPAGGDGWTYANAMLQLIEKFWAVEAMVNARAVHEGADDKFCRSWDKRPLEKWASDLRMSFIKLAEAKPAGGIQ